jgi:hypothetical protein
MIKSWKSLLVAGVAAAALSAPVGALGVSSAGAAGVHPHPIFAVLHTKSVVSSPATTHSVPTWKFSYKYEGTKYTEIFVGTNPAYGKSTTVPTYIIPVQLSQGTFVANPLSTLPDGQTVVANTVASPVFQSGVDFVQGGTNVGTTQYIDAYQRAALWKTVHNHPTYHVLLGQPTIEPLQSLTVPAGDGTVATAFGVKVLVANINWFDPLAQSLLSSLAIPKNALPIFITTQSYLSDNSGLSGCCIGGYHSYNGTRAYAQFSYIQSSGVFSQDVSALSHEIGEYINDPYTNNTDVPVSCAENGNQSRIYEIGDPLEGDANYGTYPYSLGGFTYHLQDLVTPVYFGAPAATSVNNWSTFQGTTLSVCQNGG